LYRRTWVIIVDEAIAAVRPRVIHVQHEKEERIKKTAV
jgi:hypothetical protein